MTSNKRAEELLKSGFFDGRILIEIEAWEANFHLGMAPKYDGAEGNYLGGLTYSRGFDLHGRVLAPKELRGGTIRVHLMPLASELLFIRSTTRYVGRFYFEPENRTISDHQMTLHVPEADMTYLTTGLAMKWKYLNVWVSDDDETESEVSHFGFSSILHPNYEAWIAEI